MYNRCSFLEFPCFYQHLHGSILQMDTRCAVSVLVIIASYLSTPPGYKNMVILVIHAVGQPMHQIYF